MILLLGGTRDARLLAEALAQTNHQVVYAACSEYGSSLVSEKVAQIKLIGPLDQKGLGEIISSYQVSHVLDATHPYAQHISFEAYEAALFAKIPYLRYQRSSSPNLSSQGVYLAANLDEGIAQVANLGNRIFCTLGIRHLPQLINHPLMTKKELVVRVLPQLESLQVCQALGLSPANIVAMQGPFSHELNLAFLKHYQADVLLTKDGGAMGGADTKISAAQAYGIPTVVIARPEKERGLVCSTIEEVLNYLFQGGDADVRNSGIISWKS